MFRHKRIKVGRRTIEAFQVKLLSKNLVLLKGRHGYVMCGYLNLGAAERFKDAAAKITGVSTIEQALHASIHSSTRAAKRKGIRQGLSVGEALKIIV